MKPIKVVCPSCGFLSVYIALAETDESFILLCWCMHVFTFYKAVPRREP